VAPILGVRSTLLLSVTLLLSSCAWDGVGASDALHTELARDLGGPERDDVGALSLGRRLLAQRTAPVSSDSLTLTHCFRLALTNSDSLRARGEDLFSSELQEREAIASLLPSVSLYANHTKDSNAIRFSGFGSFQPSERTGYGFTVTETLDPTVFPRLDVISEVRRIQALSLRDERDRLLFAVASDFFAVLALEADVRVLHESLVSARESSRVLRARNTNGTAREDEALLAEASAAEAESRLIRARAERDRARAQLSTKIGQPLPARLDDTYEVRPGPRDIPRLIDLALRQRYDLEAARRGVAEATARKHSAIASYLPRAELMFNHLTETEDGFNSQLDWTLGLNLSWTLFDSGGREARLARAYSAIRQREHELRELEKGIRLEVEDAVLAFQALEQALPSLRSQDRAAGAAQEVVKARLALGSATQLEALAASASRENAARDLTRTLLARKLAALRIRLAVGDLRRSAPVAALVTHE